MAKTFSVDDISSLLEVLRENNVTEFKLEREGEKLSLKRGTVAEVGEHERHAPVYMTAPQQAQASLQVLPFPVSQPSTLQQAAVAAPLSSSVTPPSAVPEPEFTGVKSPMVGTFYCRPAIDAPPYVNVGDYVKKGQVLCIVEAMKIMNEIESDVAGRVAEVCLQDGQMVEYGEVLFRINPS